MSEEEMISQINDLIEDRKSFITEDEETSEVFKKDVAALEMILDKYNKQKELIYICERGIEIKI